METENLLTKLKEIHINTSGNTEYGPDSAQVYIDKKFRKGLVKFGFGISGEEQYASEMKNKLKSA